MSSNRVMRAAYTYQGVNLLVGILMVPLLLRYLGVAEYVLWALFTTFGALTQQFEAAIQIVTTREIAREFHGGDRMTMRTVLRRARRTYWALSLTVLGPVLGVGWLYLAYAVSSTLGAEGGREWMLFCAAYALNYLFGTNNSILLGMAQVDRYNNINSLTRSVHFLGTYVLLRAGESVWGICISFSLSVLLGVILIRGAANRSCQAYYTSRGHERVDDEERGRPGSAVLLYTLYTLGTFMLYRGGLLVLTPLFPTETIGSHTLTLQICTMLSALSIVPVQVWLDRLVQAITVGNRDEESREVAKSIVAANTIFLGGIISLGVAGNALLSLIGSEILLSAELSFGLTALGFMTEMNIFLLVNLLVTRRNYSFVRVFVGTSVVGTGLGIYLAWSTANLSWALAPPVLLQGLVCLPAVLRIACAELGMTPVAFVSQLGKLVLPDLSS